MSARKTFISVFAIYVLQVARTLSQEEVTGLSFPTNSSAVSLEDPPCPGLPYRYVFIKPSAKVGEILTQVKVNVGENAKATYFIKAGNENQLFHIDERSGKIFLARPLPVVIVFKPQEIGILVSFKNKTCHAKMMMQISAFKERRLANFSSNIQERPTINPKMRSQFEELDPRQMPPGSAYSASSYAGGVLPGPPVPQPFPPQPQQQLQQPSSPYSSSSYAGGVLPGSPPQLSGQQQQEPQIPMSFQSFQSNVFPLSSNSVPGLTQQPASSGINSVGSGQNLQQSPNFAVLPNFGSSYGGGASSGGNAGNIRPPPVCSQPLYTAIISESAPIGTFVLRAFAQGNGIIWSISDTAFERFSINPTSGEVTVIGSLKRRTRAAMEFKIRATDSFGLWCDAAMRINVVSDQSASTTSNSPPYFTQNNYYFTIQCGAGGQRAGSVLATDSDQGQTVSYQLVNTNEFTIDNSGNIQSMGNVQTLSQRTFAVIAQDNGSPSQSSSASIIITVVGPCGSPPANANTPPSFGQTSYSLSASCRVNGVFVGMVTAQDYERNSVSYSISGSGEFVINPSTGEVRAQGTMTDSNPRNFFVTATDNGTPSMSSMVPVTVNIINCSPVNNPPLFGQSSYQFMIPCNTAQGITVGSTQAFDNERNQITYTISGTQEFNLNSATAFITLGNLQPGTAVRQFTVTAQDNGQPAMSSTAAVSVILTGNCQVAAPTTTALSVTSPFQTLPPQTSPAPAPNRPPQFGQASYQFMIPCSAPSGATVGSTQAFDNERNQITYTLIGTQEFNISPATGFVTLSNLLPGTAIRQFSVVAQDNGQPSMSATASIAVIFTGNCQPTTTPLPVTFPPINSPPTFGQAAYQFLIPCNSASGSTVGSTQAFDNERNQLTYTLSGTPEFNINSATGFITIIGLMPGTNMRQFIVTAQDNGQPSMSSTATVLVIFTGNCQPTTTAPPITFSPIINTPPAFGQGSYQFMIPCNSPPGSTVGSTQAFDNERNQITYTLSGTQEFNINSATGFIAIVNLFPGTAMRQLTVTAQDNGQPSMSSTANIAVIFTGNCQPTTTAPPFTFPPQPVNTPPTFGQASYQFLIPCSSSPGTTVGSTQAFDAQNDRISYTLGGTQEFNINSGTGFITLTVSFVPGTTSRQFTVTAQDNGQPSMSATAAVNVIFTGNCQPTTTPVPFTFTPPPVNTPPTFGQASYQFLIPCSSSPGTTVGSTQAFDAQNNQISYTLSGTQEFNINSITGFITLIVTFAPGTTSRQFTVTARDNGQPIMSATAVVNVLFTGNCQPTTTLAPFTFPPPQVNAPPTFGQASYQFFVPCSSSPGTSVGSIQAFDAQNNQISYTLSGTQEFNINSSGFITLTATVIPGTTTRQFTVTAQDNGQPSMSSTAAVTVTFTGNCQPTTTVIPFTFPPPPVNTPPNFGQESYQFLVPCNSSPGTSVGSTQAFDAQNNQITYTLSGTQEFGINSGTGFIRIISLQPGTTMRQFTVAAQDNGQPTMSATAAVSVILTGNCQLTTTVVPFTFRPPVVNTPPTFGQASYQFLIPCNAQPGTSIGTTQAFDNQRDQIFYTLSGTQEFNVNSATGFISLSNLQPGTAMRQFIVVAQDNGQPSMSGTASIAIVITGNCQPATTAVSVTFPPANTPPAFGQASYQFLIPCNALAGASVGSTQAFDNERNQITYTLRGTQEFNTNSATGFITVISLQPGTNIRQFSVVAADNGQPSMSATASVAIIFTGNCQPTTPSPVTIPPVNSPPTFGQASYQFMIPCNAPSGTSIGSTQAFDNERNQIRYTLNGTPEFNIDTTTGFITLFSVQQATAMRQFFVVAQDNGQPSMSARAAVSVIFTGNCQPTTTPPPFTFPTPAPNRPPQFSQTTYTFTTTCSNDASRNLGNIFATDPENGPLTYTLLNASQEFRLDQNSGNVGVATNLQFPGQRILIVTVTDIGGLSATSTVTITVNGPCGPPPAFGQSTYSATISCTNTPGLLIGAIPANYQDSQFLVYSLVNTNEFSVNNVAEVRTVVTVQSGITRTFTIIARDNRNPSFNATAQVVITVSICTTPPPPPTVPPTAPPFTFPPTPPPINPPVFRQPVFSVTVPCSNSPGYLVGVFPATYQDLQFLIYTLSSTNEFTTNNVGEIRTTVTLPSGVVRTFAINVRDSRNPLASATTQIVINVDICTTLVPPPVFSFPTQLPPFTFPPTPPPIFTLPPTQAPINPPVFRQTVFFVTVICSNSPGFLIGAFPAIYQNPQFLLYSLSNINEFTISNSGEIRTVVTLPSGAIRTFTITVLDSRNPTINATAQIIVNVDVCTTQAPPFTFPPTFPAFPTPQQIFTLPPNVQTFPTLPTFTAPPTQPTFPTPPPTAPTPARPLTPPVFTSVSYFFVVPCTNEDLVQIGVVQAVDPKGTQVSYQINGNSLEFDVDFMSGTIVSVSPLSTIGNRVITVIATDSAVLQSSATATVQIMISGPCPVPTPPPVFTTPPPFVFPTFPTQPPFFTPLQTFPTFPTLLTQPVFTFPPSPPTQPPIFTPPPPTNAPFRPPPQFSQGTYAFFVTCSATTNQLIGTVQATSSSANVITYSLVGTNDYTVSTSGEIRSPQILRGPSVVTFQVVATDNFGGTARAQIQVSVPSCLNPPVFSQQAYTATILCPNSPNVLIGAITAQYSQPQSLTYTLVNTNQFSTDNQGEIRSTILLSSGSYFFTIVATDSRNPTLNASAQVTVNVGQCQTTSTSQPVPTTPSPIITPPMPTLQPNAPPYFAVPSYSFTVVCNSLPGTAIGSVYAFDDRSAVSYSTQSQSFTIHPSTGELRTTASVVSNVPIIFTVTATDSQGLSAAASVAVSVTGCGVPNPNGPSGFVTFTNCDQATNMVSSGMVIGSLSASTTSGGVSIFSIPGDRRFSVNQNTGQLTATTSLDTGSYVFAYQISDGSTQLTSTGTFTVIVDCTLIGYRPCTPSYVETAISENTPVGSTVYTLSGSGTGTVSNSRPYGAPYSYFPSSYSSSYLTPQQLDTIQLPFATVDSGSSRAYRELEKYTKRRQSRQALSGTSFGFPMGATGGSSNWQVQKASVPGQFRVDSSNGRVTLAQPLDREQVDSYMLKVRSVSGTGYCVTKVGIEVTDINDNSPVFRNQTYVFTATCGSSNGVIGIISASDADSGLRGFVSYTILNSDNTLFGIDCYTGELRVRRAITPGLLPQTLTIQAENPTNPTRSTTVSVTINPGSGCV